jgi:hypothetical protein
MSRLNASSLTARPLRSTSLVSAPVAQRNVIKNTAAGLAHPTDQFEHSPVRSGGSQLSGLVAANGPRHAAAAIANFHLTAQQRLDFLQKKGPPQREDYLPTPSGAKQYEEAQAHYERQVSRLTAEVEYDKLKAQGGPRREDFPPTIGGALEYKKAESDYHKKLQDLLIQAGIIVT